MSRRKAETNSLLSPSKRAVSSSVQSCEICTYSSSANCFIKCCKETCSNVAHFYCLGLPALPNNPNDTSFLCESCKSPSITATLNEPILRTTEVLEDLPTTQVDIENSGMEIPEITYDIGIQKIFFFSLLFIFLISL